MSDQSRSVIHADKHSFAYTNVHTQTHTHTNTHNTCMQTNQCGNAAHVPSRYPHAIRLKMTDSDVCALITDCM